MTKIEALELELAARKMVEGTELEWNTVIRRKHAKHNLDNEFSAYYVESVEIALGIIEGKPVWEGDRLYNSEGTLFIARVSIHSSLCDLTWNPPTPKTVMVELSVEEAQYWKWLGELHEDNKSWSCEVAYPDKVAAISTSCRKALENLSQCSWNPPKPNTAMVELPIKDIEYWDSQGEFLRSVPEPKPLDVKSMTFYAACRKALENLK